MDTETRRRALRAAAKVAFGAAFVGALPGCGGRALVDSGSTAKPTAGSGASTTADARPPDATPDVADAADGGLRCLAEVELSTPPAASTPISDAQFACCRDYANGYVLRASDAGTLGAAGSDASFVNCCKAIVARVDDVSRPIVDNVYAYPAYQTCCFNNSVSTQSELWMHGYCAPWGPPVPPALAGATGSLA